METDAGAASAQRNEARGAPKGAVYRIAPDGLWDQLWESREDAPYDLAFDAENRLIVGTGNKGKIYRLEGNPLQPMLLARASAQQVTALYKDARGRLYYATANPGKLFRLSSTRATRGTYQSEVRDAQMVSTWGTVSWRGTVPNGGRVEISTRTGNSETPDDTWSAWSPAYTAAEGSSIVSPKARYLQWRATLSGSGEGPILTSVTAAYLQRNMRPRGPHHYGPSAGHRLPEAVRHGRSGSRGLRKSEHARSPSDPGGTDAARRHVTVARPPHLSERSPDARLARRR